MTKVLMICGYLRSGSTLLGGVLGSVPGMACMGESNNLWTEIERGRHCSCGEPIDRCAVWAPTLAAALGEHDLTLADVPRLRTLEHELVRLRHLRGLVHDRHRRVDEVRFYASVMAAVYRSFAKVSEAEFVVDTAKTPASGALLRWMPDTDAFFLHLVRDPRRVAYSESRHTHWEETAGRTSPPPAQPVWRSQLYWMAYQLSCEYLRRSTAGSWRRMRFEDFLNSPEASLDALASALHLPSRDWPWDPGTGVMNLAGLHEAAGNPNRFRAGEAPHVRLGGPTTAAAGAGWADLLTRPLRRRYGYGGLEASASPGERAPDATAMTLEEDHRAT